jgi:hypothetical protein
MSMRDQIAEIIDETLARYYYGSWSGMTEAADAILTALPNMSAPLVWKEGETLHETYVVHLDGRSYLVEWGFYGWASTYYVSGQLQPVDLGQRHPTREQAQAAANTHHRAAIMAAFTGETQ